MKYVSPICEMDKIETVDIMDVSRLNGEPIVPGAMWAGNLDAVDTKNTFVHLPESTLIMLVSALAGKENVMNAYEVAVNEKYRFFSFGDAMFIK